MLFLAGCRKERCFGEAGPEITLSRAASPFRQIDVYDNIDVVLTQDTVERILVKAPQHLEPNITARIENGILTLRNDGPCTGLRRASEKPVVYVHLKNLEKVVYAGSGHITSSNTLVAQTIHFYSDEGAGNINVTLDAVQTLCYIMDENADITLHGRSDVCWSYTASRGSSTLR